MNMDGDGDKKPKVEARELSDIIIELGINYISSSPIKAMTFIDKSKREDHLSHSSSIEDSCNYSSWFFKVISY